MNPRSLWAHLDVIGELVRRRPLGLISDFDGVLSEIAPSPAEARISPECRRPLAALAQRSPLVAVVSGRPAEEVARLVGLEGVVYFGVHGLERWVRGRAVLAQEAEAYRERLAALAREVGPSLPAGVLLEEKGASLALHYRRAVDPAAARRAILAVLQRLPAARGLAVGEGKMVVEVRAPTTADKGSTALALAREYGLRAAVYLGDDRTDLDAFATLRELARRADLRAAAVAVLGPETPAEVVSAADFTLEDVADVARFLAWLAEAITT